VAGYHLSIVKETASETFLQCLNDMTFDLVFVDSDAPPSSLEPLIERISKLRPNTPLVVIATTMKWQVSVALMRAGAIDILPEEGLEKVFPECIERLFGYRRRSPLHLRRQPFERAQLFEAFAAHHTDVLWIVDPHNASRLIYVSPSYLQVWGRDPDTLYADMGQWIETVHSEDRRLLKSGWDDYAARGETYSLMYRIHHPELGVRWIEENGFPIHNHAGDLIYVGSITRDVTEQKLASDRLRESEQKFRNLLEGLPQLIWTCTSTGECNFLGPQWETYTGISTEAHATAWKAAIHPDDYAMAMQAWDEAVKSAKIYDLTLRLKRHDGVYRWFKHQAMPLKDASGQIILWLGSSTDIHEQIITERKLIQESERICALGDNLHNGALYQMMESDDGKLAYSYMSASIEHITGLSSEDMINDIHSIHHLVHPEDLEGLLNEEYYSRLHAKPHDYQFRICLPNGDIRWLHCRSSPRQFDEGVRVWDGIISDITERKVAEESLKDADRRKDEFIALLAHELRNPLAPMHNALHMMRLTNEPCLQAEARLAIERQMKHMVRLVDDLLDISRITKNKLELRREVTDLKQVLFNAVETVEPLITEMKHELEITLPENSLMLDGDAMRLSQIFANLLNNAAKYTPCGGKIRLMAGYDGDNAMVIVKDSGIGIPANKLGEVFKMFTQVDSSLERSQGGLGIGLTLVRSLVEMHGGRIEASSPGTGQGCEFTVYLPLVEAATHPPVLAERLGSSVQPAVLNKRVLVVDDNEPSAKTMGWAIELMGHDVKIAHDGVTALSLAEAYLPEVILLDIGLPGMNGYELCRAMRSDERLRKSMIIAQTGWGQEEDKRRSREAGFDHHLVKPVDIAELEHLLLPADSASSCAA
jgi:PAS domain S-box-containing protein